jgi:cytochrome c
MRKTLLVLLLAVSVSAAFAKSYTPAKNTRADIKKYVDAAAAHVAKHGADCATFEKKDWRYGDYYIFVLGPDEKTVCHPTLVGKAAHDIVDAKGRHVGDEIYAASKKKGGGWTEYEWPRPGTDKPVAKSTFAKRVKGPDGKTYVVGSGGYEVK